jgi:hypothetical protein
VSLVEKAPPPSPVGIVGSHKGYPRLRLVKDFVRSLPSDAVIVSGGAPGVDQTAENEARRLGRPWMSFAVVKIDGGYKIHRQNWLGNRAIDLRLLPKLYPHFAAAAHARNALIVACLVEESGSLTVWWNLVSPGAKSMIERGRKAGILYAVYGPEGEEL